jgi:hypothetical protein
MSKILTKKIKQKKFRHRYSGILKESKQWRGNNIA